jgi:spore coat polysaccharide biosynthesis protein SpsF
MSTFNIGAIIQARMSSTRLPGKVLKTLPVDGKVTVLEQVIRRLKKSKRISKIVVATTRAGEDDVLIPVIKRERVKCFRGSEKNVLSRYYLAAREYKLDTVVRITADCPCIDPEIVDSVIKTHIAEEADYTSNTLKRSFPCGFDVEVFNFDVLKKAYKNAGNDYEKEHVTPYIYSNPGMFKLEQVKAPQRFCMPDLRITLDTPSDYMLLSFIFATLYKKDNYFNIASIIGLLNRETKSKKTGSKISKSNPLKLDLIKPR